LGGAISTSRWFWGLSLTLNKRAIMSEETKPEPSTQQVPQDQQTKAKKPSQAKRRARRARDDDDGDYDEYYEGGSGGPALTLWG
jgi:hypothetical protein